MQHIIREKAVRAVSQDRLPVQHSTRFCVTLFLTSSSQFLITAIGLHQSGILLSFQIAPLLDVATASRCFAKILQRPLNFLLWHYLYLFFDTSDKPIQKGGAEWNLLLIPRRFGSAIKECDPSSFQPQKFAHKGSIPRNPSQVSGILNIYACAEQQLEWYYWRVMAHRYVLSVIAGTLPQISESYRLSKAKHKKSSLVTSQRKHHLSKLLFLPI